MQNYIEKLLKEANRPKLDFRIFNRKTKRFFRNTSKICFVLEGDSLKLVAHGKTFSDEDIVVQRWTGEVDCKGRKIYEGDYLLTDEAGWKGFVVFNGGIFKILDHKWGYSAWPNWEACKIISNICKMDGHTDKFLPKNEKMSAHSAKSAGKHDK